ncbi:MAG: hypothetical protein Q9169_001709 [Polycauliona sp. 2 TL-2023]
MSDPNSGADTSMGSQAFQATVTDDISSKPKESDAWVYDGPTEPDTSGGWFKDDPIKPNKSANLLQDNSADKPDESSNNADSGNANDGAEAAPENPSNANDNSGWGGPPTPEPDFTNQDFDEKATKRGVHVIFASDDGASVIEIHMSYTFHHNHINNPGGLNWKKVKSLDSLRTQAPSLAQNQEVATWVEHEELQYLTIDFEPNQVVTEGIDDPRAFIQASKVNAADQFAMIRGKSRVTVFAHLTEQRPIGILEKLKKKWYLESLTHTNVEYMDKYENVVVQWGHPKFGDITRDRYARKGRDTFEDVDDWRVALGIGADREGQYQIRNSLKTMDHCMKATFVEWPAQASSNAPASDDNGLPKRYLGLLQCDNEELKKLAYGLGTRGVLCFKKPDTESRLRPEGFQFQVMPNLPYFDYRGDLVLDVHRPAGDTTPIDAKKFASLDMREYDVWAISDLSDTPVKRLINCANKVADLDPSEGRAVAEMHRLLLARDLHENPHTDILDGITSKQAKKVAKVVNRMTEVQKRAWDFIRVNPYQVVLLQSPPGTGKTHFMAMVVEILEICGISYQGAAASNSGTDAFAAKAAAACPKAGIIRGHSIQTETRGMKSFTSDPRYNQDTNANSVTEEFTSRFLSLCGLVPRLTEVINQLWKPTPKQQTTNGAASETSQEMAEVEPDIEDMDEAQKEAEFMKLLYDLLAKNKTWRAVRMPRPNARSMGLHIRVMQCVGLLRADIPCFKLGPRQKNPHKEFAAMILAGNSRDWNTEEKSHFAKLRKNAIADTIGKTNGLIHTLSASADPVYKECKQAAICMIDEACQANELETFLLWLANYDTMRRLIKIGDPCQLAPTVTSKNANKPAYTNRDGEEFDEVLVNPFVEQQSITYFERLYHRSMEIFRFTEQHRAAEGLALLYSELFYESSLPNAPSTIGRAAANKAIDWSKDNYGVSDGIPHLFLNTPYGVSSTPEGATSKVNPTNAVVSVNLAIKIIKDKLFPADRITIITGYCLQAALVRSLLRYFKVGTIGCQVEVSTIDAMQGRENDCVIFDVTVGSISSHH